MSITSPTREPRSRHFVLTTVGPVTAAHTACLLRIAYYALLFATLSIIHRALVEYPADDFFIHSRIADHLRSHGQPYYNLNDPVMAGSSAVYTLVLAGLFTLSGGVSLTVVDLFNCATLTLAAWTYARLARRALRRNSPWIDVAVGLLITAPLIESSLCRMETPLGLLLVGLGLAAYAQMQAVAFLWLAAAAFTRPELAIVFLFFTAHVIATRRVRWQHAAGFALLGGVPFVIYDWYFFGSLIPQTVAAKRAVYSLSVIQYWQLLFRFLYGPLAAYRFPQLIVLHLAVVTPCFYYLLWQNRYQFRAQRSAQIAGWSFVCGVAICAAYAWQQVLMFPWYPPLFAVLICFAAGLWTMTIRRRAVTFACLLYLTPQAAALACNAAAVFAGPQWCTEFDFHARTRQYLAVGRELYAAYPQAALMTSEIGALGHAFPGKIYDAVGLATPAAVRHHPLSVPTQRSQGYLGAIPPQYVREVRPELIVSYRNLAEAVLNDDVLTEYVQQTHTALLPDDRNLVDQQQQWYGETLYVWIRRDIFDAAQLRNRTARLSR